MALLVHFAYEEVDGTLVNLEFAVVEHAILGHFLDVNGLRLLQIFQVLFRMQVN